jgi:hypothetical protein
MSLTKRNRKIQSVSGNDFPGASDGVANSGFAQVIAQALHRDFGETHAAVKTVARLTKANERAAKNWFMAKNGPTGKRLVDLIRISDEVLEAVLIMSGRQQLVVAKKLADSKQLLIEMLRLIDELEGPPMSNDPRDIIYDAFYSALVKYHREGDRAMSHHWIKPMRSAHLTKVVMLELEANGYQIVKKGS